MEDYKQQPCEDAISRQSVINEIENDCMKGGLGSCFACYNDAQAFRGEIEKLPSVTPSRRKGHWIAKDSFEIEFKCSECEWEGYDTNFCPICGAEMVEPQESENKNE
jgi:hypothetical protein